MTGLLDNKVAIVTGAGSGLGEAAAILFAAQGAAVLAVDIDEARVAETVRQIEAAGGRAQAHGCDVADAPQVDAMVAAAVAAFGRLDVIYNNAGTTVPPVPGKGLRPLSETEPDQIDRINGVNINGVLYGCAAAIRQFDRQGGGGVIVNTASVAGLIGYGGVAYGATKGAVVALTRTLALEVAAKGIRVNAVCPAGMPTRYAGMDPTGPHAAAIREGMAKAHPLGQVIEPADVANAALFLASDMARNVTGVNLPVDGGLTAGRSLSR